MNLVDGLNNRFNVLIASKTERDFYYSAYYYFDYIFSNPQLEELYREGEVEYRKKATKIFEQFEANPQHGDSYHAQMIYKMEKFDMYCNAVTLEVRLYHPMKDYIETNDPDSHQSYLMVALDKGFKYALKVCSPRFGYRENFKKEFKENFNSWFVGQRDQYQDELSRFHVEFIDQVAQLSELSVPASAEIKPFLNLETGDFSYYGVKGNFPTSGQNFKVLKTLLTAKNYKATHTELVQSFIPNVDKATKSQKQKLTTVIRNIKIELKVLPETSLSKPDPFVSVRREGYRLELPK